MPQEWSVQILTAVFVLVPMILSLSVHEFAHAAVAKVLGDDLAQRQGRLTLNPIAHIDLIGTVILPLLLLLAGSGLFFGWAKPVPINANAFRKGIGERRGMMLTAAAGPLSNLLLAVAAQIALGFVLDTGWLTLMLQRMLLINIGLFVFNMMPIYPLDGQKVFAGFLRGEWAYRFEGLSRRFGTVILIVVIFAAPQVLSVPFGWMVNALDAVFGAT